MFCCWDHCCGWQLNWENSCAGLLIKVVLTQFSVIWEIFWSQVLVVSITTVGKLLASVETTNDWSVVVILVTEAETESLELLWVTCIGLEFVGGDLFWVSRLRSVGQSIHVLWVVLCGSADGVLLALLPELYEGWVPAICLQEGLVSVESLFILLEPVKCKHIHVIMNRISKEWNKPNTLQCYGQIQQMTNWLYVFFFQKVGSDIPCKLSP